MKPEIIDHQCKYVFNDGELLQIGKELARKNNDSQALEEDKKRVTSDFKARIDKAQAEIGILSRQLSTGYDHRYLKCQVELNEPRVGQKSIRRMDTFEVVEVLDMTAEEMQTTLEFTEK